MNQAWHSINGESFKITTSIPLKIACLADNGTHEKLCLIKVILWFLYIECAEFCQFPFLNFYEIY